ncbi:MAG: Uma2 family endonuclease [Candidatus Rokuibacteriota bacterium]
MTEHEETMAVTLRRRRFTIDEYHRMGAAGILDEDDRIELIEGEIIEMAPIGSRHAAAVARISYVFSTRLGDRAVVWSQNPLLLTRYQSEPQPDVMLLAPRSDFYAAGLPQPPDVRLLVEVADASLSYERRTKFPLYARSGVEEAWLVDLEAGRVELHRGAAAAGYRDVSIRGADELFSPVTLPDLILTLRDLLG